MRKSTLFMGMGEREIGTGEISTGSKTGMTLLSRMTKPSLFQLILARIVPNVGPTYLENTFHKFFYCTKLRYVPVLLRGNGRTGGHIPLLSRINCPDSTAFAKK